MTQKIEDKSSAVETAPGSLLNRLWAMIGHPEMHAAMQHVLNRSPRTRNVLAEFLHNAEITHNAPRLESIVRGAVPKGVSPYDYLGIDRTDFIKSVLEIPNSLPVSMNAYSPEQKLRRRVDTIDHQLHSFAELRSELTELGKKKKIDLYDFVGGRFDNYVSSGSGQAFEALRTDSTHHHLRLMADVSILSNDDFIAIRNVRKVGFNVASAIIGFKVLADKTDGFKTLAALPQPLGLPLPSNVVVFARPEKP